MGSFQHSKRSDNKRCTLEVRRGIFIENLTVFFLFLRAVVNTDSNNFVMALIWRDDHLTAGAWATCGMIGDRKKGGQEERWEWAWLGCYWGVLSEK